MKTWESLYKTWLKQHIETLEQSLKNTKQSRSDLKLEKETYMSKKTCRCSRYENEYAAKLADIHYDLFNDRRMITFYLSELNRLKGKENSHTCEKKTYSTFSFNYPEFNIASENLYALCFDIQEFEIHKITKLSKTDIYTINPYDVSDKIKNEQIIRIDTKENLEIELSKINEELRKDNTEYFETSEILKEKTLSYRKQINKMEAKIEKEKKELEEKIKKMRKEFTESHEEEKKEMRELETKQYTLRSSLNSKKENLFKELKNA